jgi:hypothetical protein
VTESMDDWGFELHALYRIYDPFGRPLYFGETGDLPGRLRQHMEKAWFRRPEITIKVTWFPNRAEALAAETAAIAAEKPWHNKSGLNGAVAAKLPSAEERQPAASERRPSIAEEKRRLAGERQRIAEEERRMAEEKERRRRDQPPRDLLADLRQVVTGDERIRLSTLPHLLRQLAPEHVAYEPLTGTRLREELQRIGVRVYTTGGTLRLDPADLRVTLKKAG